MAQSRTLKKAITMAEFTAQQSKPSVASAGTTIKGTPRLANMSEQVLDRSFTFLDPYVPF